MCQILPKPYTHQHNQNRIPWKGGSWCHVEKSHCIDEVDEVDTCTLFLYLVTVTTCGAADGGGEKSNLALRTLSFLKEKKSQVGFRYHILGGMAEEMWKEEERPKHRKLQHHGHMVTATTCPTPNPRPPSSPSNLKTCQTACPKCLAAQLSSSLPQLAGQSW